MNISRPTPSRSISLVANSSRHRGFALLVTIVLVAFLVLIVVGLATFTRVETQVAGNGEAVAKARQNAMFGLQLAIGGLQETAGPDARATATADLTNPTSPNRDWTGVWAVNTGTGLLTTATPLRWLVSGNSAPAAVTTSLVGGSTAIRLARAGIETPAGSGSFDRDIWVDRERIRSRGVAGIDPASEVTIGTFAYHVSDEGLKASLSELPSTGLVHGYYTAANPAARDRLLQLGGRAPRGFESVTAYDQYTAPIQTALAAVVQNAQLRFADAANLTADEIRARRPDYTVNSMAVLANPATGSLKRDLSFDAANASALGAGITPYLNLIGTTRAQVGTTTGVTGGPVPITAYSSSGEIAYVAAPLITQFSLQTTAFAGAGDLAANNAARLADPNIELRTRFFVEIWNPFTDALLIPSGQQLRVVITGLPTLTLETNNAAVYGTAAPINLGTVYNNIPETGAIALTFDPPDFLSTPAGDVLVPGRLYTGVPPPGYAGTPALDTAKQTLGFGSTNPNLQTIKFRSTYWNRSGGALSGVPDSNMQTRNVISTSTSLVVRLEMGSGGTWTLLSRAELPAFTATTTPFVARNAERNPRLGFHVRLNERGATANASWLTTVDDVRRQVYPQGVFTYVVDDNPASYNTDLEPSDGTTERATLLNRNTAATSGTYDTDQYNFDVPLLELPRQEWVSVGNLQHLAFVDSADPEPLYALGNSWARDNRNNWFDRFFFSTIPSSTTTGVVTLDLPNRHLVRVPTATGAALLDDETVRGTPAQTARHVMIQNAFNVNSTSVEAWKAVLGGLRFQNWEYVTRNNGDGTVTGLANQNLANPFFRFPQSAQETWEFDTVSPTTLANNFRRFYRRGVRSLTQDQVNALAEETVAQIRSVRSSTGPFPSLQSFLAPITPTTGNVFEEAIEATDARAAEDERVNWDTSLTPSPGAAIDARSPSALTAADLMTALAPFASTRSDTFVIRAYGAATSPLDANAAAAAGALPTPEAEAWLEATVQRVPEPVDSGDDPVTPTGAFGRKFKVVSFRWLTPNDL